MQLILALLVLALPFAATAAEPELEKSVRALADVFSALEQNLAEPFNAEDSAMAGKLTVVEVEQLVEIGEIDPDDIHLPGIYVNRIVVNSSPEKRIEQRTMRAA